MFRSRRIQVGATLEGPLIGSVRILQHIRQNQRAAGFMLADGRFLFSIHRAIKTKPLISSIMMVIGVTLAPSLIQSCFIAQPNSPFLSKKASPPEISPDIM